MGWGEAQGPPPEDVERTLRLLLNEAASELARAPRCSRTEPCGVGNAFHVLLYGECWYTDPPLLVCQSDISGARAVVG